MLHGIHGEDCETSDDILISRVLAGEIDAYAILLRREMPRLRSFIALKLPVPHLVDEIAHESFVYAYQHLAGFDVEKPFRPWLRAIAWQLVRKEIQRYAREQVNLSRIELAQFVRASAIPIPNDESYYLEECLERIDPTRRLLIEQKYRDGLSSGEMADIHQRTVEWVRVNLFRAREMLRSCIVAKIQENSHAI
jgi:RNA polymerase sigma-70 factor, ECF subfamily